VTGAAADEHDARLPVALVPGIAAPSDARAVERLRVS